MGEARLKPGIVVRCGRMEASAVDPAGTERLI